MKDPSFFTDNSNRNVRKVDDASEVTRYGQSLAAEIESYVESIDTELPFAPLSALYSGSSGCEYFLVMKGSWSQRRP